MSASHPFGPETPALAAILGQDVVVKGEIHSREPLTVIGTVDGIINIPEHRLTITSSARVRAKVSAREIELHGTLNGQAQAKELICIRKGAEITGDVRSVRMVIEDGAFVKGIVEITKL